MTDKALKYFRWLSSRLCHYNVDEFGLAEVLALKN